LPLIGLPRSKKQNPPRHSKALLSQMWSPWGAASYHPDRPQWSTGVVTCFFNAR
jgi:hypothetical protein